MTLNGQNHISALFIIVVYNCLKLLGHTEQRLTATVNDCLTTIHARMVWKMEQALFQFCFLYRVTRNGSA